VEEDEEEEMTHGDPALPFNSPPAGLRIKTEEERPMHQ